MKEFSKTQKVTYNLMSFTGFKSLLIFSILTESPKSYKEISDIMENNPYLKEKISIDTMRVYLNSLKRIGCEIKRVKGEDKISRYTITSHPFELKVTPEQLQALTKIYKNLIKNMDIKDIIYLENFFEKISKYIKNDEITGILNNYSLLKGINKDLLEELINYCDKKTQIIMSYNSPNSGIKDIEIITDHIEILNNKVYLNGFGLEYNHNNNFLVSRIKKIKDKKLFDNKPSETKKIKVIYEINAENINFEKTDYEKIVKENNNKLIIESETSNIFFFKQRLLQFGPQCKIITPDDFKEDFVNTLRKMKEVYCNG